MTFLRSSEHGCTDGIQHGEGKIKLNRKAESGKHTRRTGCCTTPTQWPCGVEKESDLAARPNSWMVST